MTESEQQAMLSAEDVAKLQTEKAPVGCLIILIVLLLMGGGAVGVFLNSSLIWVAVYGLVAAAIFVGYFISERKPTGSLIRTFGPAARM